MKKVALTLIIIILGLTACSTSETLKGEEPLVEEPSSEINQERDEADMSNLLTLELKIGNEVFIARFYENQTTQAFVELLPLSMDMEDLHKNEKFYYLSDEIPTDSESPGVINAGEIMLYGADCLVLFYENFSTSYNYTRLGYIEDVAGFTQAVGDGDITVFLDLAKNNE